MKLSMLTLAVMAILAGVGAPASAAARERSAGPEHAAQPDGSSQQVCREEAFEADPAGQYGGYPCWARKAFAPRR